jgi:hypothetical protein
MTPIIRKGGREKGGGKREQGTGNREQVNSIPGAKQLRAEGRAPKHSGERG